MSDTTHDHVRTKLVIVSMVGSNVDVSCNASGLQDNLSTYLQRRHEDPVHDGSTQSVTASSNARLEAMLGGVG